MDGGAWWATVHGVTKSQTQLSDQTKLRSLEVLSWWLSSEESSCNAGDTGDSGLIPGLGKSLGKGTGYAPQYSSLENSMDCIVHGVPKSWTRLSDLAAAAAQTRKVMLKILQARFQQCINQELPNVHYHALIPWLIMR